MNILITGSSGTIGSFLRRELSVLHTVYGLSRKAGEGVIQADLFLLKEEEISDILKKYNIDIVIHCAAERNPTSQQDFLLNSFILNKFFTGSYGKRVRYIVFGSAAEYGSGKNSAILETVLCTPQTMYGASKLLQTTLCEYYITSQGYSISVLRLFNIISHSLPFTSFIGRLCAEVASDSKTPVEINNLDIERDFVDIRDLSRLISCMVEHPGSSGVYNIGSGHATTYGECLHVMNKLLEAEGRAKISYTVLGRPEILHAGYADISKVSKEYGWTPQYTLGESFKWCLKNIDAPPR